MYHKRMPPRTAKVVNEPVFIKKDGVVEQYVPARITTHRDAYAASLHLLFKHVADFHMLMIDVIAEKYKLDPNEIVDTLQRDPRYNEVRSDPKIESLMYFDEEDLSKKVAAMNLSEAPVVEAPATEEPSKPIKKRRIVKKIPTVSIASVDT